LCAYSGVQRILCCVFVLFVSVLRIICCQFLWTGLSIFWLPLRYSLRRVWRYQRGNQNPYIEEQKKQWPKEKVQKDKQRSTKRLFIDRFFSSSLRSYLDMSHNQNYWYMDFCHTFYIYKLDNFHHWNSIYHSAVIFLEVFWMEDDYKTYNIWCWVCLHFLPERKGNLWKESLNSDGQQFHLYKPNEQSPLTSTR